jgi:site-specific recombinase XerD
MKSFEQFLVIKGLQPVTVRGHTEGAERVLKNIGTYNPNLDQAREFIAKLYISECSHSHKSNQAQSLEYWLEYIGNPIKFGRQRKPKRLLKDTLSEAEVARMIFMSKTSKQKALLTLLAYSGLRPKEVCRVRVHDINFGLNELRVEQGKCAKDSIVYLSSKCIETLMKYMAECHYLPGDTLFKTYQGNPYNQQALRKMVHVAGKRADIEKRVYPYLLRHSLVTNMVKRGAPILYIKEHFRHAWIETTMLYIHSIGRQDRSEQYFPQYM